jgi:hypothetical protein
MKTLLTQFRLSNALDEKAGGPIPDSLREKISARPELREFARRAAALDRGLRRPPAVPPADATLHASIMEAVRASAAEAGSSGVAVRFGDRGISPLPNGETSTRIGLATAFAAFAVIAIWLAVRPPRQVFPATASNTQTMDAAQLVLDMSGEISRTVPGSVVAPLSNELACVDHDIRDTTQFVLAVLP